tara:strand:+ start:226 stop:702 length:477 start_codon:yes stop_codon:yes gene_type:complete
MSSRVIWLTGLPCSGKTTLALHLKGILGGYVLDGDDLREGLCSDLGFSKKDREENIRRIGEVAKILEGNVIVSLVSPYRKSRDKVRELIEWEKDFIEVYVDCDLDVCKERDVKGLYAKTKNELTPVYEAPLTPEIHVKTDKYNIDECLMKIIRGIINK